MKTLKNIVSILIILLLVGCSSTRNKITATTKIDKDTLIVKSDSIKISEISKSIDDLVFLPIQTGDHKIDSVITTRLKSFKTFKKSGENSYKITYDKVNKGFAIASKIGETQSVLVKKIDSLKNIKQKVIIKEEEAIITRYRTPSWVFAIFLVALIVLYILTKIKII